MKKEPLHITILGLGPSIDDYTMHVKCLGGRASYCDQVWAINAAGLVMDCDMIFHMDDVRVQEARAKARPKSNIANMIRSLKKTTTPVMTCHVEPGYKSLREYPLNDVIGDLGECYFNNTAAYAVAYAIWLGATTISIFGCDYSYEHSHHAERGRACVEFWIAIAKARGIKIVLPQNTSLLDAYEGQQALFYGFCDSRTMTLGADDDGRMIATSEEKPLPTADEIEHRYNHARPTSKHVEQGATQPT